MKTPSASHPAADEMQGATTRSASGLILAWILIITVFTVSSYPPDVQAMLAPTETEMIGGPPNPNRMKETTRLQRLLEAKVVQQRLADFGLTPDEISSRISELSDEQLHHVATQIDSLIPGDGELGVVIALLIIAILVVILIYLLDHKIVITKQ